MLLTIEHFLVCDAFAFQIVFGDDFIDFLHCLFREMCLSHVKLDDSIILQESSLERGSITLLNLITGNVQLPYVCVVTNILRQGLAECVT